ncbi:hypothetical protein ACFE04_013109 [Oxalis oulophora]
MHDFGMAILDEKQQLTVLIPFYHLSYTVQPQRPYAVMLICLLEIFVLGFSPNPNHGFRPPSLNSTEFHLGGSIGGLDTIATQEIRAASRTTSSDDVKDIGKVLSVFFASLSSNFGHFVKWTVEVVDQEDCS